MTSAFVLRVRNILVLSFLSLLGWQLWALTGIPYRDRVMTRKNTDVYSIPVQDRSPKPLPELLGVASSREMFKPSVFYATKEAVKVDILANLVFLGVVQQGKERRAFIQNTETKQANLYSKGDMLGDIQIQEIQDDRVILAHGEEKLELMK